MTSNTSKQEAEALWLDLNKIGIMQQDANLQCVIELISAYIEAAWQAGLRDAKLDQRIEQMRKELSK